MSNRSSSKRHGYATVNITRPKSSQKKRSNKVSARAKRDEKNTKRFSLFDSAVSKLGSKY